MRQTDPLEIRNEHGVELNLVFNANAGDPATNILMDVGDKFPGYRSRRRTLGTRSRTGDFRLANGTVTGPTRRGSETVSM